MCLATLGIYLAVTKSLELLCSGCFYRFSTRRLPPESREGAVTPVIGGR